MGLPWTLVDFPGVRLNEIRLFVILLHIAANLALTNDVDVVCLLSLLEKFAASNPDAKLERLLQGFQLFVAKVLKHRHLAQVREHLLLLPHLLLV